MKGTNDMTENDFLDLFFQEAGMQVNYQNRNLEVCLDIFKQTKAMLKQNTDRYNLQLEEAKLKAAKIVTEDLERKYKKHLNDFEYLKNTTIQDLLERLDDCCDC